MVGLCLPKVDGFLSLRLFLQPLLAVVGVELQRNSAAYMYTPYAHEHMTRPAVEFASHRSTVLVLP